LPRKKSKVPAVPEYLESAPSIFGERDVDLFPPILGVRGSLALKQNRGRSRASPDFFKKPTSEMYSPAIHYRWVLDDMDVCLSSLMHAFREKQGHRGGQCTAGVSGLAPASAPERPHRLHGRPHRRRNPGGHGSTWAVLNTSLDF
jgi:hypothetical protein